MATDIKQQEYRVSIKTELSAACINAGITDEDAISAIVDKRTDAIYTEFKVSAEEVRAEALQNMKNQKAAHRNVERLRVIIASLTSALSEIGYEVQEQDDGIVVTKRQRHGNSTDVSADHSCGQVVSSSPERVPEAPTVVWNA